MKTCPLFFNAILTPSWQVPPALLTFKRHLPVTKADVLLTFCTFSYIRKKPTVKTAGGTCQDGVLIEDIHFKGADMELD